MANYFEELARGVSGAVSNASDYLNKSINEKGIFGTIDSLAGEFSTTIRSGKQLLNASKLQEQVDRENEENRRRQTQLLELAKKEKDVNKKKVYLDIASNIKSVNQEDLDSVVNSMNKDVISNVAGTALDVASLTPLGGFAKGFTAAGKAAKIAKAEEAARKSMEAKKVYDNLSTSGKFLSKTATLGKEMAKGAGVGTAFGVTAGLTERPEDRNLMESATFGATLGAGMPVVGTILGGAFVGIKGGVNKSKPVYEKIKKNLDEFSKSDKLKGDFASDYLKVRMEQKPTIFQKAAGKTVKTLESIEKIPQRFLDANNIFLKGEEQLLREKRKTNPNATISDEERIYLNRKMSSSKVAELNRKDDEEVLALIEKNQDIKDDIQRIQIAQRDLERVENGLPSRSYLNPENPLTKEEAIENLAKARSVVPSDKLERVDTALQEWSDYFKKDLQKEVELGHKTQKEVDTIMSKNINYVPFNTVQEDIEDMANRYAIGGTEIPKDYIKKQSGSLGRITDPWQAQRAKIQMRNDFLIKNKNNRELVDASTKYNLGIANPLQTAKEISRKEELINRMVTASGSKKTIESIKNIEEKRIRDLKNRNKFTDIYRKQVEKDIARIEREGIKEAEKKKSINIKKIDNELTKRENEYKKLVDNISKNEDLLISDKEIASMKDEISTLISSARGNIKALKESSKYKGREEVDRSDFNLLMKDIRSGINSSIYKSNKLSEEKARAILKSQKASSQIKKDSNKIDKLNKEIDKLNIEYDNIPEGNAELLKSTKNKLELRQSVLDNIYKKLEERKGQIGYDEETVNILKAQIDDINKLRRESWQEIQTLGKKELPEGYTEIPVWRDGVKESWAIKNDVAEVIKNTDRSEVLQVVGDLFQPVNNVFKKLTTTLNPAFQLANKMRDTQTVWITAKSLIEERAEKYGLANLKLSDTEMNDIYKRMKTNYSVNKEYEAGNKLLNSVGLKKEIDPNKNIYEQATNFLEDSTRKEVFKEALRSGLDVDSAASVARDATIDFEKMGTYMQDLNRIFPFLNARVQGLANTTTSLVKNPEAFMRNQTMTAMYPTMILDRHNNNFESYKDIDQQTKDRFWVYMIGENDVIDNGVEKKVPLYITIPKGEAQQMIANPMQYFLAKARSQDPRSVDKMILDTVGSASPVTIDTGISSGKNPLLSLASMNPITSVAAGLISNKQPYFQTDIVPTNLKEANQAAYTKFKETTPEMLKDLSKQIYDKSGGKLDWSPAYMEFAIKSFGGLPSDVLKQMNVMYNASQGKPTEALGEKGEVKPLEGYQKVLQEGTKHMISNKFLREMDTDYSPTKQEEEKEFKEIEKKELTAKAETKNEVKEYINTATQKLIEGGEDKAYDYLSEVVDNAYNTMPKDKADEFAQKITDSYEEVYDKMVVGSNTGLVKTGNSLKDAWSATKKLNELETPEEKQEYMDLLYDIGYMTPAVESAFESLVRAGKVNGLEFEEVE